jgi:energy-coupling factor transporter ATP-binding protein EcfA2
MSMVTTERSEDAWPGLSAQRARLSRLLSIRIIYPRWQRILDEIGRCHEMYGIAAEPQCLLLVGPTGAGKSTLVASYAQRFPPLVSETGIGRPVVRATIPASATIKSLATTLLAALGDPRATYGTVGSMTYRLIHFFRDCGVELVILDELQHFRDRDSHTVLENASNWLKTLIKETGVSCVLVGLQGEAEEVVRLNRQLARLFGDPQILRPFTWDEGTPETVQEFRTFLGLLEGVLPLAEPSGLAEYATARRLYLASEGIVAYLMELVRRATYLAVTQGHDHLDTARLAAAFDQRLAGGRRGIANPFAEDAPVGGATRVS